VGVASTSAPGNYTDGWAEASHPILREFPAATLLAPPGTVILPQHLPNSNIGHHGGIAPQELLIPLLDD